MDKYRNDCIGTNPKESHFTANYISKGCLLIKDGKMKHQSLLPGEVFYLKDADFKKGLTRH